MTESNIDTGRLDKAVAHWLQSITQLIGGKEFDANLQNAAGVALLDISIEHIQSIHVLCGERQYASARALMRPAAEGCIRGIWMYRCATKRAACRIVKYGAPFAGTKQLTQDIGAVAPPLGDALSDFVEQIMPMLHDFTHGGTRMITRRFSPGFIGRQVDDAHHQPMLCWAASLAYVAAIETSVLCRDLGLAKSLRTSYGTCFAGTPLDRQ